MWASLVALWQLLCLPLTYLSLTPTALVLAILSVGPLPKHVAFIMDGNRRWARVLTPEAVAGYSKGVENGSIDGEVAQKTISGHQSGFQALKRVLDLCLQLGRIEHVTVYAFAIDNFKRKQSEVDELMALARQSLVELAGHGELLARYSARLKVVGRKEMLPVDVQEAVQRVEDLTKNNRGPTLNICIPYSSRDEMAGAIRARTQAHLNSMAAERSGHCSNGNGHVNGNSDDAELALLEKEMQLAHSPPVDIMVRTSGVHRLSDFMLWQITPQTTVHFVPTFWPNFGLRDLLPILLQWQALQFRRWLWDRAEATQAAAHEQGVSNHGFATSVGKHRPTDSFT